MQFITLDVFTDTCFLGNPLALVIVDDKERESLSKARKQLVAKEFNLSETAFLYLRPGESLQHPDRTSSVREVSIYTSEAELPFAGHPTIGIVYFLVQHLDWDFVDTIIPPCGPIRILKAEHGRVSASIPHDTHLHSRTLRSLHEQAGAQAAAQVRPALHGDEDIRGAELDAPVFSIVKGMTFILVELPSLGHLARAGPGRRLGPGSCAGLLDAGPWGHGFVARYYYVRHEVKAAGEDVQARMVELGFEDPATGSAASCLASYLSLAGGVDEVRYRVTQGVEMGRKSDIEVNVISGVGGEGRRVIKEVRLGGTAKVVMRGDITM